MKRLLPTVAIACLLVSACAPQRGTGVLTNGTLITGAGANVIAAGGGNVVSAGGGNLTAGASAAKTSPAAGAIALPATVRLAMPAAIDASGVVAVGGGNYRLTALPAPDALARGVRDNTFIYTRTTALIDGILKGVSQLRLTPGKSFTFPDPDKPGRKLTVLVEAKADHAVLSVGTGDSARGAGQVFGMRFTGPRQGRAVFHIEDGADGRMYIATDFDLDAQTATADGAHDTTAAGGAEAKQVLGRWTFQRREAPAAREGAFSMTGAVAIHRPEAPTEDGVMAFAANFLPDGQGAFLFGVQNQATGDRFLFLPRDGISFLADPPAEHDFYMTRSGEDLPKAQATRTLIGIAPQDSAIDRAFPASPRDADPFASERFAFPE